MRKLLILLTFISNQVFAQIYFSRQNEHLYELDQNIRKGDFNALIEIGRYFDSKEPMTEFLGHHLINTDESNVSKRIVRENSFFLADEIRIDSTTTSKEFNNFLLKNRNKIKFSDLADGFIITPFENRRTAFEILELTAAKKEFLDSNKEKLINSDLVKQNNIDRLIAQKNPEVLLRLASVLLKNRYRFNEYFHDGDQIIYLIQLLTQSQIAVPNETGKMSYHIEKEFYDTTKVNLVIFFANHYKDYHWDEAQNQFVNKNLKFKKLGIENNLFDLLSSKTDSVAIDSFIQLTETDPGNVIELAGQYDSNRIAYNYVLPTFAYRFLKQLSVLTEYCRQNGIDYKGSQELQNSIELLKSKLSFSERRKLEDKLIDSLTLDEITAFEYWSLVYEKKSNLVYSAGRILDKFYSKNWDKLIKDPKQLEIYLLKTKLYKDLGIIGLNNNYIIKFIGNPGEARQYLETINSANPKIADQQKTAIALTHEQIKFTDKEKKDWDGDIDGEVKDFAEAFKKVKRNSKDKKEFEKNVSYLLSQINYSQIGEALTAIDQLEIEPYELYSFMNRDFGLSFIGNFEESEIRKDFLENYQKLDEQNLYKHYLKKAGIDFTDSDGNLDFDKIYEILKFDINTAFVGGGGSTKDNGVYAVIKLLELNFGTTLDYPRKLCSSNNMWACNSRDRAAAWMNYLEINQYLKMPHKEPVSFAFKES